MGLLDALNSDEGMQALGLLAAAGPSATPMSFGQRLFGAMQQDQSRRSEAEDRKMRKQMQQMHMQQLMEAAAGRKREQEQQQQRLGYLGAIDSSQGPAMPVSTPRALAAGLSLPEIVALQPQGDKPDDFKVVGGSLVRIGPKGVSEAYRAPEKAPEGSSLAKLMSEMNALPPGSPMRAVYQNAINKATTHQPATNVNVGDRPPAGYRWNGAGGLEPIPGGPADKLPEKQQNTVVGVQNLKAAIQEYRDALRGFGGLDALKPDARAKMGTKYNNMMLQAKEAYNLGVLNGPDLGILTSVITDPRSITGVVTSKEALDSQARELDRIMSGIADVASQTRPRGGQQPAAASSASGAASSASGGLPSAEDIAAELARRSAGGR